MSAVSVTLGPQARRFSVYLDRLCDGVGHADRKIPLYNYCVGLLLPGERKSIEPLAARLAPSHAKKLHQSLHHFVSESPWSDAEILRRVRGYVLPVMEAKDHIVSWQVEETVLPKKGTHTTGVARHVLGHTGRGENCQVAISLWIVNGWTSCPVAWQLYLTREWVSDRRQRLQEEGLYKVRYRTESRMALEQIRQAVNEDIPRGVLVASSAIGTDPVFRSVVSRLGLKYVVGVEPSAKVLVQDQQSLSRQLITGQPAPSVQPMNRRGGDAHSKPGGTRALSVQQVALSLSPLSWKCISWRQGTRRGLSSMFAAVRVRPAGNANREGTLCPEEWLLIEWPRGEPQPRDYWISTLPAHMPLGELVNQVKRCWIVERDSQELKQEVGLAHYEGRGWRGIHHHATLCVAAYGFLVAERNSYCPWGRVGKLELPPPQIVAASDPRTVVRP